MGPAAHSPSFSNNPHTVYNGMLSGQRNMYAVSSIAVVLFGASTKLDTALARAVTKTVALGMMALSIVIGHRATCDYTFYLAKMGDRLPPHIPRDHWALWPNVIYAYAAMLVAIMLVMTWSSA